MNESWMSHVTYEWVMSQVWSRRSRWIEGSRAVVHFESCHKWMSHITSEWVEWVMLHMDESCLQGSSTLHVTNGWFMSHVTDGWVMSQVNESCPMWMSHGAHGWVVPGQQHILMHVTNGRVKSQVSKSCPSWMSHVATACVVSHVWSRSSRRNRGYQVMSLILSDVTNVTSLILRCHSFERHSARNASWNKACVEPVH